MPFSLSPFPLAPVRAAIDAIEEEMLVVARADAAGTTAVVAENAAREAAGRPRLTTRAAQAVCGRFGGDWSGLRFLRLVKRLVRVDGAYWKMRDWNRGVARKRALLEAARESAEARAKLLAALGGETACERWERCAAGLGRRLSPGSSRGRCRNRDDFDVGSQTRAAPVQGRGRSDVFGGVEVRLPSLSRTAERKRHHQSRRDETRAVRRSPLSAPIPVWPCEVLTNDAYDAMTARVRDAVAEKDAELAATGETAKTRRRPAKDNGGVFSRAGRPLGGARAGGVRAGGHASNEPLYAALHGKRAHP